MVEEHALEMVLGNAGRRRRTDQRRLCARGEADLDPDALGGSARISSMVRVLIVVARGSDERSRRRSTIRESTPRRPSSIAAARPAGPAPTITTGEFLSFIRTPLSSDNMSFIGQYVFDRICCQVKAIS
jgi:hypothetical protein